MAGQVWGGIEAGLLNLSIIADVTFLAMWALVALKKKGKLSSKRGHDRALGTHLWRTALILSYAPSAPNRFKRWNP